MLYVFLVDTGSMLTFDMNLALGSVASLKQAIAAKCKVPEEKQVLLISGGESLNTNSRVCSYGAAGTDTSPIFLFGKSTIESQNPPSPMIDYGPDPDVKDRVESCLDMEPSYNTVVARAELAKHLCEMTSQQLHVCERLVHDQHLQHQGWRAVVANLEDIVKTFAGSMSQLEQNYAQFLRSKDSSRELLLNFKHDLSLLSRIPLLPGLVNSDNAPLETTTLLDWISQKDSECSLEQIAEKCLAALERFNEDTLSELKDESDKNVEGASNADMQEIKGLEERLYGLEKLMAEAKRVTAEQNDLSNSIYQNQQRASNLRGDVSIFPDLCKSHRTQLQHMLKNHQQLRDIRRRCVQAKKELSSNIHSRLRWIMFIEKKLADVDSKILIYRETIRRLRRHLDMIQQVHMAPTLYLTAVVEVVRRKRFSGAFLQWSTRLAQFSSHTYQKETIARQNFITELNSHFVSTLFPGLEDTPPPYAVEAPDPFDLFLPSLTADEVNYLRDLLPELSDVLTLPVNDEVSKLNNDFARMPFGKMTDSGNYLAVEQGDVSMKKVSLELETQTSLDAERIDKSTQSPSETTDVAMLVGSSMENLKSDASTFTSLQLKDAEEIEHKLVEMEAVLAAKCQELESERTSLEESDAKLSAQKAFLVKVYQKVRESLGDQRNICGILRGQCAEFKTALSGIVSEVSQTFVEKLTQQQETIEKCTEQLDEAIDAHIQQQKESNEKIVELESNVDKLKVDVTQYEEAISKLEEEHGKEIEKIMTESEEAVRKVNLERELELEDEIKRVSMVHEDTIQAMELDAKSMEVKLKMVEEEKKSTENELLLRCQKEKELLANALHDKCSKEKQQLRLDFSIQLKEINDNHEKEKATLTASVEEGKSKALKELREKLALDHKNEMESLRYRFKMVQSTRDIERSSDSLSLTPEDKKGINLHHQVSALHREIDDMKRVHHGELERQRVEQQEEIKQLRASYLADRKEFCDSDSVKARLRTRDDQMRQFQNREASLKSALVTLKLELEKHENAQQLVPLLSPVSSCLEDRSSPEVIAGEELTDSFNSKMANDQEKKVVSLEIQLREKETHISQLQQQLLVSPSTLGSFDKIAVLSCDVGDVILLCFTERYNSYVVFSLNPVLHFLHNDSEESLELRPGPGEQRKSWALAEITDKEYCQARRPQNRYRVAAGTRFYRIKAKPWSHPMVESRRMSASMMVTSPNLAAGREDDIVGRAGAEAATVSLPMSTSCFPHIGSPGSSGQ